MIRLLIQNWWLLLVRGMFALAFAVFIFFFLPFVPAPLLRELAYAGLIVIFALFAVITGLITMVAGVRGAGQGGASWLLLTDGIAVTSGGLIIFISSTLTLAHIVQIIALTVLLVGIIEMVAGSHLRRHIIDEWLLLSGGVVSLAFAAGLLVTRGGDVQVILRWIAFYALANGLAIMGLAFRLRKLRNSIQTLAVPDTDSKTRAGTA